MSGLLRWMFEVHGVEKGSKDVRTFAQAVRDADKAMSTVSSASNLKKWQEKFSESANVKTPGRKIGSGTTFASLNPDLFKAGGQAAGKKFQEGLAAGSEEGKSPSVGGRLGPLAKLVSIRGDTGLGKILTATGALATAFYTLRAVSEAVQFSFRQFMEAIQRGSKLYLDAAKTGLSTSRLARAQNAAGLIGMDESEVQALLLRGEFGNRRGASSPGRPGAPRRQGGAISLMGEVFGAYSTNQLGDLQKAINLNKELKMALQDTALATDADARSARALFEEEYNFKLVWTDLKALFSSLAAELHPIIASFGAFLDLLVKFQLWVTNTYLKLYQALGLIPSDDSAKFSKTGVGQGRIPVSQFERIGFSFGGFGGGGSAVDQTAKNTGKAVTYLAQMAGSLKALEVRSGASDPNKPAFNINSLDPAHRAEFLREHPAYNMP